MAQRPSDRRKNAVAIAVVLLLVLGPLVMAGIHQEVAAWHAAEGLSAAWDERFDEALDHYQRAIAWDPHTAATYALQAQTLLGLGRVSEAVVAAEAAYDRAPDSALMVYADALLKAGRGKEAADVLQGYHDALPDFQAAERASAANNIAATLAIANIELDRAHKLADRAIEETDGETYDLSRISYLDTRAMVRYRQGRYAEALTDADSALEAPESLRKALEAMADMASAETRQRERKLAAASRLMATLFYHRMLIHEGLAKEATDAEARRSHDVSASLDRWNIRELGFEPEESLF